MSCKVAKLALPMRRLSINAAGDGCFPPWLDLLVGFPAPGLVQVGCEVFAAEVVREGDAALSQFGRASRAASAMIWFSSCCGGAQASLLHALLEARVMEVVEVAVEHPLRVAFSTPVRRSLMRDWSST